MKDWIKGLDGTSENGVWCYVGYEKDKYVAVAKVLRHSLIEYNNPVWDPDEDRFWIEDEEWFDSAKPIDNEELVDALEKNSVI